MVVVGIVGEGSEGELMVVVGFVEVSVVVVGWGWG